MSTIPKTPFSKPIFRADQPLNLNPVTLCTMVKSSWDMPGAKILVLEILSCKPEKNRTLEEYTKFQQLNPLCPDHQLLKKTFWMELEHSLQCCHIQKPWENIHSNYPFCTPEIPCKPSINGNRKLGSGNISPNQLNKLIIYHKKSFL